MTSRNVALAKPSPVNQATRPAYFPAWSPYGDHIAYSVEVTPRGGVKHGAIEVVPVVKVTGLVDARAVPVVVTAEMTSDNEYRPSWSKDAKYIAFYADQAGLGGSNTKVSIGVVEVVTNARTGNVFRGEVREGKERWLADNVIPDETRGPAWSSLLEGMSKKDVLLYVERKSAGANAVMAAGLDRFLSKSPRSEYETEMSGGWNVANPKWVTAAELNQMVRYVYTSVASGGEVVANYDQAARWSTGPDPVLSGGRAVASAPAAGGGRAAAPTQAAPTEAIIIVHRGQDVLRALLFPGMGQHSYGGTGKGIALNVLGVAGAGVALLGYSGMSGPLSDGKAAVDAVTRDPNTVTANRDKYNTAQTAFNSKQSQFSAGAGLYLAAWAYGILDASFKSAPGSGSGLSLTPEITPSRSGSSLGMRLGYSVPLGQRPR